MTKPKKQQSKLSGELAIGMWRGWWNFIFIECRF